MWTILFDIDGTLIRTQGVGMGAMGQTIRELYGDVNVPDISVHGRTDRGIIGEIFETLQMPLKGDIASFYRAYCKRLEAWIVNSEGYTLPGVEPVLEILDQDPDVALGILTGNVRRAAEIKLDRFGLREYFHFGGYGDEHADRNDVASAAWVSARNYLGKKFDPEKIWVIGDTRNDVRCARSINAKALAVETGGESSELLATSGPDMQLKNLERADAWLDTLKSPNRLKQYR